VGAGQHAIVVRRNTPIVDARAPSSCFCSAATGRRQRSRRAMAARSSIAFSPDGAPLFATLDATGSDLWSIGADGSGETAIAHLSDEIARDWKLSPDGTVIAYTVAESGAQPRIATMTVVLASGTIADAVEASAAQLEFSPAWTPDGELTVAAVDPASGAGSVAVRDDASASAITSSD
jgi:Tol biopolymer transport system component